MAGFGGGFGAGAAKDPHNPNNDSAVVSPPTDGITSLCFSSKANHLVATSWDNHVRFWEVAPQQGPSGVMAASTPKAAVQHSGPVLCSAWHPEGNKVFSAGCDKQAKVWDLASNAHTQVAQHDAPIKDIAYAAEMNCLITAGWDKTVKYWDLRQSAGTPVHSQAMPERVYAMSVNYPLMVVGTADRQLQVFNLTAPQTVFKSLASPLKYQTRCLTCFPDKSGYLVGSIEGRVAVQHIDDNQASKNFTFKCHRVDNTEIYAVNSMAFHPGYGTFATAGADGTYNFWDKDSKQRLKAMARADNSIPCGTFNNDGSLYAYAVSYDWHKGYAEYNPATAKNSIFLHVNQEADVKNRPKTKSK
mmetsp:Transcript_5915/g.15190  ORF Transcript_5915/g.15190 Transcript_5915/m.15190 type:complete len:358 (-) Transcript_5915:105-1178(-)